MKPPSFIELNKSALKKNIKYLKKRIKSAKFVSVIKGNAYGHGIEDYLPLAEECGVKIFAVSDSTEAFRAFNVKKKNSRLIILNMIDNEDLSWAIENGISFFVFSFNRLENTIKIAKKLKIRAKIHLEIETGLNRTGFSEAEMNKVINLYKKNRDILDLEGVCTHYAGAESIANYHRLMKQKELFDKVRQTLEENNVEPGNYHTACSAAALTYEDTIMDMVRFGISQYGFWPSNETRMYNMLSDEEHFTKDPLKRILSWKSKIISMKKVKAGQFIGYGNQYLAQENIKTAVIPIGYYHGFSRSLSNLGYVLINGKKSPVLGMVNMNMIVTDISLIPEARIDDEVVIIGEQGNERISVSSFSDLANYVNYEMLVRLPFEIPRIIVE